MEQNVSLYSLLQDVSKEWFQLIFGDDGLTDELYNCWIKLRKRSGTRFVPSPSEILKALTFKPPCEIEAIILGYDPHPDPLLATGLAFSLPEGQTCPSTTEMIKALVCANIETEVEGTSHCFEHWAERGVLMLNSFLTVNEDVFLDSVKHKFWLGFTKRLVLLTVKERAKKSTKPILAILMGSNNVDVEDYLKRELGTEFDQNVICHCIDHPVYPKGTTSFVESMAGLLNDTAYTTYRHLFMPRDEEFRESLENVQI